MTRCRRGRPPSGGRSRRRTGTSRSRSPDRSPPRPGPGTGPTSRGPCAAPPGTGGGRPATRREPTSHSTVRSTKKARKYRPFHLVEAPGPGRRRPRAARDAARSRRGRRCARSGRARPSSPTGRAAASRARAWSRSTSRQPNAARTKNMRTRSSSAVRLITTCRPSTASSAPARQPSGVERNSRRPMRHSISTDSVPRTAVMKRQPNGVRPNIHSPSGDHPLARRRVHDEGPGVGERDRPGGGRGSAGRRSCGPARCPRSRGAAAPRRPWRSTSRRRSPPAGCPGARSGSPRPGRRRAPARASPTPTASGKRGTRRSRRSVPGRAAYPNRRSRACQSRGAVVGRVPTTGERVTSRHRAACPAAGVRAGRYSCIR